MVILYGDPQGLRSILGPVTPHDLTNFFNPLYTGPIKNLPNKEAPQKALIDTREDPRRK